MTPASAVIQAFDSPVTGRLVHYDLDGIFIAEVVTGLALPTSGAIQGDYEPIPNRDAPKSGAPAPAVIAGAGAPAYVVLG